MTDISIRERGIVHAGPVVTIDGQEYAITLTDPFSAEEEQRLEWYFEQYYQHAITLYIEFNERYNQARTYVQLGLLAAAQSQPTQATNYLCQALIIFHEFNDEHSTQLTLHSLARFWQDSGLADLPATVAHVLNQSPDKVKAQLEHLLANAKSPDDSN